MKSNVKSLEEIKNALLALAMTRDADPKTLAMVAQALGIDWQEAQRGR